MIEADWRAERLKLLGDIDKMAIEIHRLYRMLEEPDVTDAAIDRYANAITVKFRCNHWAIAILAHNFGHLLGDAPNFITGELGDFVFTIQRKGGKSPNDIIEETRKHLKAMVRVAGKQTWSGDDTKSYIAAEDFVIEAEKVSQANANRIADPIQD